MKKLKNTPTTNNEANVLLKCCHIKDKQIQLVRAGNIKGALWLEQRLLDAGYRKAVYIHQYICKTIGH